LIYKWPALSGYMLQQVAPDANVLPAEPGETWETVLERLPATCDRFWFHVACTIATSFPTGRMQLLSELAQRGIQTVNALVNDVSKSYVQRFNREHGFPDVAADPAGDPDELLIVKTNDNCVGDAEQYLSKSARDLLGLEPSPPAGFQYQVLPRCQIDPAYWSDPGLVCERFIENRLGVWYRAYLRRPKMALVQFRSAARIKKVDPSTRMQITWLRTDDDSCGSSTIATLMLGFINEFQLDFGAVDVVTDLNGFAAVIDVNPTPWRTVQPGVAEYLAG